MTREPVDPERMARLGRVGGHARAAKLSPEERREIARKAVTTRWERENARRADEGLQPTRKTTPLLSDAAKDHYLALVDEQFGPSYPWKYPIDRIRQAEKLARADAARAAAEAWRASGGTVAE